MATKYETTLLTGELETIAITVTRTEDSFKVTDENGTDWDWNLVKDTFNGFELRHIFALEV
jgi:hypothetical protein